MRALIVGGGCRGLDLTRALVADGHAARVVTRTEAGRAAIEAAGGECWIGDPDVIGTLRYALENVTLVFWLLGTASGPDAERLAALHGSRLRMMLEKTTDTTVRGVVYEAAGTVGAGDARVRASREMEHARRTNEIPFALIDADPRGDRAAWLAQAQRRGGAAARRSAPRVGLSGAQAAAPQTVMPYSRISAWSLGVTCCSACGGDAELLRVVGLGGVEEELVARRLGLERAADQRGLRLLAGRRVDRVEAACWRARRPSWRASAPARRRRRCRSCRRTGAPSGRPGPPRCSPRRPG